MNNNSIMTADVLDILFEKRNKAYGAYMLRKFYNNRLIKSMGIMVAVVVIFSAFTFLPDPPLPLSVITFSEPRFAPPPQSPKTPEVKPKVKTAVAPPAISTIKLVSRIIMVNKPDSADVLRNLHEEAIGSTTNIVMNVPSAQIVVPPAAGTDAGEPANSSVPTMDVTKPLETAEIMPAYPGGMDALRKFLVKNLVNPRALEDGELISVKVKFVVGYDGKLQRFELVQDGGTEFNNEVIRVLKKMPEWIPGKSKGQNVSVFYTIPVKFMAEN